MSTKLQIDKPKGFSFVAILTLISSALISLLYACFVLKDLTAISMWGLGFAFLIVNLSSFKNISCDFKCKIIATLLVVVGFGVGFGLLFAHLEDKEDEEGYE